MAHVLAYRDFIKEVKQLKSVDEAMLQPTHSKVRLFGDKGDNAGLSCVLRNVQFSENPNSEVVRDGAGVYRFSLKMGKGDTQENVGVLAFDSRVTHWESEPLFYLNNKPLANYYHCLTDGLGILYSFLKQSTCKQILMYRNPPHGMRETHCDFVRDMLKLALPETHVQFVNHNTLYSAVMTGSYLGLNSKRQRAIPHSGLYEMYDRIKASCNKTVSGPRKIFITRMPRAKSRDALPENNLSYRELVNEGELLELMQGYGFSPVFAEDYTLEEQVSLFSQATHVTGPWGAGFINTVFCKPGVIILPFGSPNFSLNLRKRSNVYCGPLFADKKIIPLNGLGKTLTETNVTNAPWKIDIDGTRASLETIGGFL